MTFSFNFSGDDIEPELDAGSGPAQAIAPSNGTTTNNGAAASSLANNAPAIQVKSHDLKEWLSALPSRISYDTTTIESPLGKKIHLPRRELFDIRQQLMAEDDESTLNHIDSSDLRTGVYEGGFKTWECSIDLSSLLLDRGPRKDIDELARVDRVIELGAGSALPSLVLFQHAIQNAYPVHFTLADYNEAVLRLVTLPNLLLTHARYGVSPVLLQEKAGDLEVTPVLVESFLKTLADTGVSLSFLSGPWGPELLKLISEGAAEQGTVVLAAETIYSPDSTAAFVELVVEILKRTKMAKAIVAAKRIYFGVGGSVDGLKEACNERGAVAYEVENSGVKGMDQGVGRALLEIQMY